MVGNIERERQNTGYKHISLFTQCLPNPSLNGEVKSMDCLVKLLIFTIEKKFGSNQFRSLCR